MKVILAYSGGLDTSIALNWLQKCYDAEVITFTAEIGQSCDLKAVEQKAKQLNAVKTYSMDLTEEYANEYILPSIKANGLYQGSYPLHSALSRPLIVEKMIEVAKAEGADAVAHGSTGKGNDQVRFDVSFMALAPELKIIAPAREWNMSRPQLLEYAEEHGIPLNSVPKANYSIDENIWGISVEGGDLENPGNIQTPMTGLAYPESGSDTPATVEIEFSSGEPVALNGKKTGLVGLINKLNIIGKQHGIGIVDHMEDRVIGLKSREVYQCPAAEILIKAHKDLEKYVSTAHQNQFKSTIDQKWAELVFGGLWHDPLKKDLDAYIEAANKNVSGAVKLKLFKGKASVIARSSANALYIHKQITYEDGDEFDHFAAQKFISLYGMPTKVAGKLAGAIQNGKAEVIQNGKAGAIQNDKAMGN